MGFEFRAPLPRPLSREGTNELFDALERDPACRVTARGENWLRLNFSSPGDNALLGVGRIPEVDDINLSISPSDIYVLFNSGNLKTAVPAFMARVEQQLGQHGVEIHFEDA